MNSYHKYYLRVNEKSARKMEVAEGKKVPKL